MAKPQELLGFENVADVPGMQGLADVSTEQLLQWNPENELNTNRRNRLKRE